jgi:hypothetical protein
MYWIHYAGRLEPEHITRIVMECAHVPLEAQIYAGRTSLPYRKSGRNRMYQVFVLIVKKMAVEVKKHNENGEYQLNIWEFRILACNSTSVFITEQMICECERFCYGTRFRLAIYLMLTSPQPNVFGTVDDRL